MEAKLSVEKGKEDRWGLRGGELRVQGEPASYFVFVLYLPKKNELFLLLFCSLLFANIGQIPDSNLLPN